MTILMLEQVLKGFRNLGIDLKSNDIEAVHLLNKKLWIILKDSALPELLKISDTSTKDSDSYNRMELNEIAKKIVQSLKKDYILQNKDQFEDLILALTDSQMNRTEILATYQESNIQASSSTKQPINYSSHPSSKILDKPGHPNDQSPSPKQLYQITGVKNIIAICSGKGGVGKSTITVALAKALFKNGYSTGIIDADIYGASIPLMLGIEEQLKQDNKDNNLFIPIEKEGLQVISVSMITDEALLWRGPMAVKMLYSLLCQTRWGYPRFGTKLLGIKPLDFLLIDTPPGTSDIHLSLASHYNIRGSIMVTTPCQIAMVQTAKSITLMKKMGINIYGVVENIREDINKISENKEINDVQKWAQEHDIRWLGYIRRNQVNEDMKIVVNNIIGTLESKSNP